MRSWNPSKPLAWSPKQQGEKIKLTCRFISPVFGGGVDPKKPDEITPVRVPSIRGQLRFWWRATHADLSLEELRARESKIFGGVHGDKPAASALSIQVIRQPRAPQRLEVFERGSPFKLAPRTSEALAYGAFPLRGTDAAKIHDLLSVYSDSFELELSIHPKHNEEDDPPDYRKEVERALWAWLHFGGLGGRTRRGFGAIELIQPSNWKLPSIQEGWPSEDRSRDAEWAVLGTNLETVSRSTKPYDSGSKAQEELLGLLRQMRQGDLGRKPNKPRPGRSYWPEPDAIRALFRMTGGRHGTPIHNPRIDKFPRAGFGAPIIFHFKTEPGEREPPDTTLVPVLGGKALSRLSSPLILRPHAGQGGKYEAMALKLEHPWLKDWALQVRKDAEHKNLSVSLDAGEAARIAPLNGPNGHYTDVAAAYLARLAALLPGRIFVMSTHLMLIQALSPIHCGTGQAISGIDLPIAREKPTGIPLIPGSSLKGVLRAQPGGYEIAEGKNKARPHHLLAFGPETENASEHAGAVQFGDAHLLFLPVRSVRGTFAWATSPYLLKRFARDVKERGYSWPIPKLAETIDKEALVTGKRLLVKVQNQEKVVFEDFDFVARTSSELDAFARLFGERLFGKEAQDDIKYFAERVCVVSDDVMRVLSRVGMEIVARNRISNETKTVEKGALWTEEALPVESILAGLLVVTPVKKDATEETLFGHVKSLCKGAIQLGGKATIGRGVCKVEVL